MESGCDREQLRDFAFPSGFFVFRLIARSRRQHGAIGLFFLPQSKRELVLGHQAELRTFQWTCDRSPGDLLPEAARFLIAHQEVLIVDARQMEVQVASLNAAGPDQTRVAERSIGDDNG